MSLLANSSVIAAAGGIIASDIGHSLRSRSAASTYLSRTLGTPTDNTSWFLSMFIKRGALGAVMSIFSAGNSEIFFQSDNTLQFYKDGAAVATSTTLFRDPTSHGHLSIQSNGTTVKAYWNTVEFLSYTGTIPDFNSAVAHTLGRYAGSATEYFDGYLSRIAFVDGGGSLTPQDFVTYNSTINELVSKTQAEVKALVDAGGNNSTMLDFDDATSLTTLGYDKSTHGNHWTLNNFSLTAGTTYDHMLDAGNSFATFNPLIPSAANISNGNLTSGATAVRATMNALAFDSKWEVTAGASAVTAGVISSSGTASTTTVTANKTFAFRLTTAGALDYRNVTDSGAWNSITTGLTGEQYPYGTGAAANWNFGQAPLHASATYQSGALGYFFDTTSGFKALCQANMPTPAILNPEQHHDVILVTKSGDTNFTLPWDATVYDTLFEIKNRGASATWYQVDGLRGYDKILHSDTTASETTDANVISVSGTTGTLKSTLADGTYVITCWKAGLASDRQTNSEGSITSTVSRNVESGFAIVLYTGTGANATVGHGLGKALGMLTVKGRNGAAKYWCTQHASLLGTEYLLCPATNAKAVDATVWNSTLASSTVFSLGSNVTVNTSTNSYVAYCYAEIPGYSKFGSYVGNAAADGAYADCGFKAKTLEIKCASAAGNWVRLNSLCAGYNVDNNPLLLNTTAAEATTDLLDLTSVGFKQRSTNADTNAAQTYIFIAIADVAGKYSSAR